MTSTSTTTSLLVLLLAFCCCFTATVTNAFQGGQVHSSSRRVTLLPNSNGNIHVVKRRSPSACTVVKPSSRRSVIIISSKKKKNQLTLLHSNNGDFDPYSDYYNVNYDDDYASRRGRISSTDYDRYNEPVGGVGGGRGFVDDEYIPPPPPLLGGAGDFYEPSFYRRGSSITKHLWIVIFATTWWYLYSSFQIVAHPPKDYFFKIEKDTLQNLGAAVAFAPLPIFAAMTQLGKATTLRGAQTLVVVLTAVAMPTSVLICIINPTSSRGYTALAFVETTLFFGTYIAHYLRQASYREIYPPPPPPPVRNTFQALSEYRPPPFYQSTHVAADLSKSMVAFVIAISVMGQSLIDKKGDLMDMFPFNDKLWPWVLVALHAGHECMINACYPGAQLNRFRPYMLAETSFYAVYMYAAFSSPVVQKWAMTSTGKYHLADQILVVWFVANAATKLLEQTSRIVQSIDFDRRLGLSNAPSNLYDNDGRGGRFDDDGRGGGFFGFGRRWF